MQNATETMRPTGLDLESILLLDDRLIDPRCPHCGTGLDATQALQVLLKHLQAAATTPGPPRAPSGVVIVLDTPYLDSHHLCPHCETHLHAELAQELLEYGPYHLRR